MVVLTANTSLGSFVTRANVKIIEPNLAITYADKSRIEIENKSKEEVNLYGRRLYSNGSYFDIPKDTIVLPGSKINISSKISEIYPSGLEDVRILLEGESVENKSVMNEVNVETAQVDKELEVARIQNELALLYSELESMQKQNLEVRPSFKEEVSNSMETIVNDVEDTNTANVINALNIQGEASKRTWLNTIKMFFLNR